MSHQAQATSDHEKIRKWAEQRGGKPATVGETQQGADPAGVLRIDFPGYGEDEPFEHISWDERFRKCDEDNLAILLQEEQDGNPSRFNKIVSRDSLTP